MKRIVFLSCLFLLVTITVSSANFTVVIDPGHGGRDGGAVRGNIKEKDINLAVALNLGKLIEDSYSDVKVIYTRKTDVFVDLYKRAEIANKAKANLFISIHTNSTAAKSTTVSGADTYILGLARSEENRKVQERENEVILLEDDYKQRYAGFDPKSPESYIIFEFMTNKYMEQSLEFASVCQQNFKSVAKRVDRGVKQAGFLVLRETAMPSVLIELGFINNPTEAKYLASAIGQRTLASSIFAGFKNYKKEFDKKEGSKNIGVLNAKTETADVVLPNQPEVQPAPDNSSEFISKPKQAPVAARSTPKTEAKPVAEKTVSENKEIPQGKIAPEQIEYRVQILISETKLDSSSPKFQGVTPIDLYMDNGIYKYTYGSTTDREEAVRIQRELRGKFKDAFIIEFRNGKRIK